MTEAVNTGPQPIDHNKGKQYRCHSRKINQKQDHSTRSHFVISGRLGEAGRSEFAMKLKKRREESCKRSFRGTDSIRFSSSEEFRFLLK